MTLNPNPFTQIKQGTKTVEIRLYDEKRRGLSVGDTLSFSLSTDPSQTLQTEIINLKVFPSFKELFYAFSPSSYGSVHADEWVDMYKYYSKEDEQKHGTLAIILKLSS